MSTATANPVGQAPSAAVPRRHQTWFVPVASLGLFVSGYEHLSLYRRDYRFVPVIGVLFLLNVAASGLTGAVLLFRREVLVRLAGLAVAVTTLGFFGASRLPGGVFGFSETGLQPSPQAAITLIAESVTVVFIVAGLVGPFRRSADRHARHRGPGAPPARSTMPWVP
jgi:hypothetical protein